MNLLLEHAILDEKLANIKAQEWRKQCERSGCDKWCKFIRDGFCGKVEENDLSEDAMPPGAVTWMIREGMTATAICRIGTWPEPLPPESGF